MKSDLQRVEKKLREASFFLRKMIDLGALVVGDREPFDFYLSAFLSAARSVDYRLRHEEGNLYTNWRAAWDKQLSHDEDQLIKFMIDDRNVEVHESGSGRDVRAEKQRIAGRYSDRSGTIEIAEPPLAIRADNPSVPQQDWHSYVTKPTYSFTINGIERKATDVCAEYLSLLQRMMAAFKVDNP